MTTTQAGPVTLAAADLTAGRKTARQLLEPCLERIADPAGEGARVFLAVSGEAARASAGHVDAMRRLGHVPSPLAGIPVSVKDLFDVGGEITRAGSRALADRAPAGADAPVIARLRAAGCVIVGRTNMTEFAYSGLGLNPHFGTPANPWDRASRRIPGGSSSGAAISITDGMALAALGTDTGGSCRIPAALTGIVGFKPTACRVPLAGTIPLSSSLDSIGPLAASVACCAAIDAIMAGEPIEPLPDLPLAGIRLAVPRTLALEDLDATIATAFERALSTLARAGARIETIAFPDLMRIPEANAKGGLAAAEAFAWHRRLLEAKGDLYDPRVAARIRRGAEQSAADYIDVIQARADLIARAAAVTAPFDALAMPTVPIVAPAIAALDDAAAYNRTNLLLLRNPAIANFLDRCSISLPCHRAGEPPVGLMLIGEHMTDRRLLALAAAIERALAPESD